VDRDHPLDRAEGVVEPAHQVGGAAQLLEDLGLLGRGQSPDQVRGSAVMGVRLPIGLQSRRSPRGDERAAADDILGARLLRVVDDVRRVTSRCGPRQPARRSSGST
jgi:hypothetical protein